MKKEELNLEENIMLISSVIKNSQGNFQKSSFYFLLWGWIVVLANLGHYSLMAFTSYTHPYIVWLIVIPGWVLTFIFAYKQDRSARVITHFDRTLGALWVAFGVSVLVLVVFGQDVNRYFNPIILMMAAIPTLATGFMIRFTPLIDGGICFYAFGIICFFISPELHYILTPMAILIGYLIPGHLLRKRER